MATTGKRKAVATLESQNTAKSLGDLADASTKVAAAERQLTADFKAVQEQLADERDTLATCERANDKMQAEIATLKAAKVEADKAHERGIAAMVKDTEKMSALLTKREDQIEALQQQLVESRDDAKREADALRAAAAVAGNRILKFEEMMRKVKQEVG